MWHGRLARGLAVLRKRRWYWTDIRTSAAFFSRGQQNAALGLIRLRRLSLGHEAHGRAAHATSSSPHPNPPNPLPSTGPREITPQLLPRGTSSRFIVQFSSDVAVAVES